MLVSCFFTWFNFMLFILSNIIQDSCFCLDIIKQRIYLFKLPHRFIVILNPQVEAMKKSYHTACKEEKLAASRENNSKLENNNPEAQKKLQEKVEKCQQEVQKVPVLRLKAIHFFYRKRSGSHIHQRHGS